MTDKECRQEQRSEKLWEELRASSPVHCRECSKLVEVDGDPACEDHPRHTCYTTAECPRILAGRSVKCIGCQESDTRIYDDEVIPLCAIHGEKIYRCLFPFHKY